jgi:ATP-binding cassette, subfamily B, bacterial
MPPIETANTKALRLYMSYWRVFWRHAIPSFLFSLMLALQMTLIPLFIALTLGQLVHDQIINVGLIVAAGVVQALLIVFSYLTDSYGVALLHDKVVKKLYDDSFRYLLAREYSFFTNNFSGSIVTQASRFAKVYTTFNDTVFFGVMPQLFSAVIILAIMFYYSPLLALIVAVLWLFSVWLVVKFALQRLPLRRSAVAKESEQVGELADSIGNAVSIKTFASEEREISRYSALNSLRGTLFLRSWRRAVRNAWLVRGVCVTMQMIVFVGGIVAVKDGHISIATFLLFQVYILRMIQNIDDSVFIVRQLEAVSGDAQEMSELFDQPPQVQDKPSAQKSKIRKGAIQFQEVNFQYQDGAQNEALFANFELDIKAGEKVGLIGPSGGGKTTITRLLLRFMDIQSGAIKIDGQDIRDIKQTDLRRAIAYVPQDPALFHRSIKENIAYGRPDANEEEIVEVAKKSYAHDFIVNLPQGYDTLVGERGVKLSGGQRQRIAIARAMLANAPILVLDEATSALDSESERLIQKALWELMKDKTAVVIAHRLSTIRHLNRIIVLDEGRIIEQGTHQALLKRKGLYAKLWSHQSGGFIFEE